MGRGGWARRVLRRLAVLAAWASCRAFAAGAGGAAGEGPFPPGRIYLGSRPSVSGDGKTFVFEWNDTIWLAPTAGGEASALLEGPSRDEWPALSPDGRRVAFASDRDGGKKIFSLDLDSGRVEQVSFHSEGALPFAWLDGGREVLALTYASTSPDPMYGRIARIPAGRRGPESIFFDAAGAEPSLSPDGGRLLFTRKGDDLYRKGTRSSLASQVWLYECGARRFTPLVRRDTESRTPLWLPDGKRFYYVSGQDGCMNVWLRDPEKGAERQITFFTGDSVIHPSLSADGGTMVFRRGFDFYRMDPRRPGRRPVKIALTARTAQSRPPARRRYYNSCWNNDSPGMAAFCDNGMQIAFTTGGDLFVMDTQIRSPRLVHGCSRTHERECVFSRDGRTLYYLSDRGDGVDLWKAGPGDRDRQWWENFTFEKKRLTNDDAHRTNLKISADGTRLSWQDALGRIHIADTNGAETALGPRASGAGDYAWSPDGKWMAAAIQDAYANSDVWIFPVTPTNIAPYNLSRCFKGDYDPCWSPDGKLIAFTGARPDSDEQNLFYVWLNPEDEAAEKLVKKREDARKKVEGSRDKAAPPAGKKEEKKEKEEKKPADGPADGKADGAERPAEDRKAPEKEDRAAPGAGADTKEKAPAEKAPAEGKDAPPDAQPAAGPKDVAIDFDQLHKRVRRVRVRASAPFFSHDSRTIAFAGADGTYKITVPDKLSPARMTARRGENARWIKEGDRILWTVGALPAHFNQSFPFQVYQETDCADYRELVFLTAWGRLRDRFYDAGFHGADWPAVKEKYRLAARNAPSMSVFTRVMLMMLGELNASHLGFYATDASIAEWEKRAPSFQSWAVQTAHLGLLFDPAGPGPGWLVKTVIPGGPAGRGEADIRPGDRILSVDGLAAEPGQDPAALLNGAAGRIVTLSVKRAGGAVETVPLRTASCQQIRDLRKTNRSDGLRRRVHRATGGRLGYLDIGVMDWQNYCRFEEEIFSEGFGKDGMIIDVRNNIGGYVADRILGVLCGASHSLAAYRDSPPAYLCGYWGKPVFDRPIVVLCNETTASNGEIFSHAVKTLGRGKLVGVPTGGRVIATEDRPLLDFGNLRMPSRGWFLPDGTDMDGHGAVPDARVEEDPNREIRGDDVQLDAAISVLRESVKAYQAAHPPAPLRFYR